MNYKDFYFRSVEDACESRREFHNLGGFSEPVRFSSLNGGWWVVRVPFVFVEMFERAFFWLYASGVGGSYSNIH